MLTGKWTYRSYRNDPALVGDDSQKALALIFGEGVFDLETAPGHALTGTFDMGGDYVLDVSGTALPGPDGQTIVRLSGIGRAGGRQTVGTTSMSARRPMRGRRPCARSPRSSVRSCAPSRMAARPRA